MQTVDPKRHAEVAERVEQRRKELAERTDVSQTMRKLSQSSGRNPMPVLKKRSGLVALLLVVVAVVVMVACAVSAIGLVAGNVWLQNQLSDPTTTTQKFYAALHQKNYSDAYSYFSTQAQQQLSSDAFGDMYASFDQVDGIVDTYSVQSSNISGNTATVVMLVMRRGQATAQVQTVQLVNENGNWKIASIVLGDNVSLPTATS